MIIYSVQPGDSVNKIASRYGVTPLRIIADNGLAEPEKLSVGQKLFIEKPRMTHKVSENENIYSIAQMYGLTLNDLWRMNPELRGRQELEADQVLTVNQSKPIMGDISINGYTYENIKPDILIQTLPYLTYLTIFSYGIGPDGTLIDIDDDSLIETARSYGVAPIMMLANIDANGNYSAELADNILTDSALSEQLISSIINNLSEKRYHGVEVDFEFVGEKNAVSYADFVNRLRNVLGQQGYELFVQLEPKISDEKRGILYDGHDYERLGNAADKVMLQTYEWGHSFGEPMAPAPIKNVTKVLDYATSGIPAQKIFLGIPTFGFDWQLPYIEGQSRGKTVFDGEASSYAYEKKSEIKYDNDVKAPFFSYYDTALGRPAEHIVWFGDAQSVKERLMLAHEYNLHGFGIWTIMKYFPQLWAVLNSIYRIRKVLK